MIFHDIPQNSDRWFNLRIGKVGGSSIGKIMANYGKALGKPAKDLATKIAVEQITGNRLEQEYSNSHMARGHEQEPIAREMYEQQYFTEVYNGGFFEDGNMGVSPDGVVDKGLIEIKSVVANVHYDNLVRQSYDPTYKWQLFYNVMVAKKEWIDFVSYCASFPENRQLFVYRVMAEDCYREFDKINERLAQFFELVEERKEVILNSSYFVGD